MNYHLHSDGSNGTFKSSTISAIFRFSRKSLLGLFPTLSTHFLKNGTISVTFKSTPPTVCIRNVFNFRILLPKNPNRGSNGLNPS